MKILIGVMACGSDSCKQTQQLSRETWVKDAGHLGDFKFFIGRGNEKLEDDEEMLDVSDSKECVTEKSVALLAWALHRDYDFIFKIDNDTYLNIDLLAQQDYQKYDYVGAPVGTLGELYSNTAAWSFIQGSSQGLSRKAAQLIVAGALPLMRDKIPAWEKYCGLISPHSHSEDLWCGQILGPLIKTGEIQAFADHDFTNGPKTFHFALYKGWFNLIKWFHGLHDRRSDIDEMMRFHKMRETECVF